MKSIKTFESWNSNKIDNTLFSSGKAKYNAKVVGNTITYKTGDSTPYYFAEISEKGNKFICKIYEKGKDGEDKRLRNKIKKELQLAHNYVREFLNQRLKKDEEKPKDKDKKKKKKKKSKKNKNKFDFPMEPQLDMMPDFDTPDTKTPTKERTIIRRF